MGIEDIFENVRPIQDYVAIKRIPREEVSKGGIIIPATAGEAARPYEGIVLAIGPGRFDGNGKRMPPPELKKGDHVCFGKYAGAEAALMSEDYLLVRWELIDAVIES